MKNKCWVVKIGSALLTNNGKGIDKGLISQWVEQIVELQSHGIDVVLVSSGSIVEGMKRLGWKEKPSDIHKLQAAAAVGQMGLVQAYEYLFAKHKVQTAQVLLTRDNLLNSKHFENISAPGSRWFSHENWRKVRTLQSSVPLEREGQWPERVAGQIVPQKTNRLFRKVRVKRWGKSPPRRG